MRAPDFWLRNCGGTLATLLAPLGWIYGSTVARKHRTAKPWRATVPVICVGNLTAGGSGKTPVAIAIARQLQAGGTEHAWFLTRGYGGRQRESVVVDLNTHTAEAVGDEALLLAHTAPTIVARDRGEGARLAERHGADAIVMDDGFQNFTLAKDLSLVVVDAETGFGNGHVLPAGPLREPIRQGLARADAVVLMGDGTPDLQGFDGPVLRARLVPATQTALQDARVVAFAGIGRPEKFFHTLQALGANVVERHAFADHHAFTSAEIAQLKDAARRLDARLVTTEKDRARLSADAREGVETLGVDAIFEGPEALSRLMAAARINVHS